MSAHDPWIAIDAGLLRRWPLPEVAADADKEVRGLALVIAGSREIAGAALLAGTAALRAGAGKLVIAAPACTAPALAIAMPEARVIGLPENERGGLRSEAIECLREVASSADGVLAGPGLVDEPATCDFVEALLPLLHENARVILDALAMKVIQRLGRFPRAVVLTPHAGEMAGLMGRPKDDVQEESEVIAGEASSRWNAVVALKGATTCIAAPGGGRWRHEAALPGLATSGSGDVLAGAIAGLLARQATLEQAAAWGVALHATAGAALSHQEGPIGFLARELPAQFPKLLREFGPQAAAATSGKSRSS